MFYVLCSTFYDLNPELNKNFESLLSFNLIANNNVRDAVIAVNILVTTPMKKTRAKPFMTVVVAKK